MSSRYLARHFRNAKLSVREYSLPYGCLGARLSEVACPNDIATTSDWMSQKLTRDGRRSCKGLTKGHYSECTAVYDDRWLCAPVKAAPECCKRAHTQFWLTQRQTAVREQQRHQSGPRTLQIMESWSLEAEDRLRFDFYHDGGWIQPVACEYSTYIHSGHLSAIVLSR